MEEPLAHEFVNISLMPLDVREQDGEIQFTEAPEKQVDHTPEQICRICYAPLDADTFHKPCEGAGVPDDLSELTDTRPEEG